MRADHAPIRTTVTTCLMIGLECDSMLLLAIWSESYFKNETTKEWTMNFINMLDHLKLHYHDLFWLKQEISWLISIIFLHLLQKWCLVPLRHPYYLYFEYHVILPYRPPFLESSAVPSSAVQSTAVPSSAAVSYTHLAQLTLVNGIKHWNSGDS